MVERELSNDDDEDKLDEDIDFYTDTYKKQNKIETSKKKIKHEFAD